MKTSQMLLRVIAEPEPGTRVIFHHDGPNSIAVTGTDRSAPAICCAGCGATLLKGIVDVNFDNVVFRCYVCGAFNDSVIA
jgi:hypothetical protein